MLIRQCGAIVLMAISLLQANVSLAGDDITDMVRQQDSYAQKLLEAALSAANFNGNPKASRLVTDNLSEDIVWAAAHNIADTSEHQVIKIPVFRGLLSYYSVIYHKPTILRNSDGSFRQHEIGMLHNDGIANALQAQGYKVVKTRAVQSLVQMLNKARFEAMLTPAATVTGLSVTQAYKTPQQITMLHNPWYFVVHKDKPELALALEQGLNKMLEDGSLNKLMENTQWMQALKQHLAQHQSLSLYLTETTQFQPAPETAKGFWVFSPQQQYQSDLLTASN